ncbi:GroS Co-chaperonin GroES (HSP10) [uncultured Caudovirales phage]|uniref:GroS Co-chaperonin GroES (HSP10) n=1 Tax=uncultured Caudovirales phage TaxID=2100421 RepID=A0A6J5RYJ0_9CAUD|nr:GroS Co-chaperonin GroES (HSP10) [uncultured Caudovirales phage]CAB4182220.1 GroS Co-chaperonin GroES (HSP10) [uncultured Caudovirales phage]CAB4198578.1 GroS Co-chaperonin GroES (HSP10) [uncultured Caudovirales phage]CAB4211512.1 GroS Co-chaperonin GroES (HSP10) [uncultured Caudovirales phage]CAB5238625.1 GroS Co-chaperonin GroES (HSP10) [uncultured Caudovirales phage]
MNILPLNTQVLVAENKKEDKTESGIIIEGIRNPLNTAKATVLAVGPDVTEVKINDVVLLDWAKASPVKIGDVQRAMIKEEFIIAVFEN